QFNNTGVTSRKINFKNIYLLNYNNYLYFLESKLENFLKFNSNNGWQNSDEKCKTLEAFMHFSYKYSEQQLVICDLQGDLWNYDYELTDAAINSQTGGLFGLTDMGLVGMQNVLS